MRIGGYEKLSTVDYPGEMACSIFLVGCNFNCGYCHNPSLISGNGEYIDKKELSGMNFPEKIFFLPQDDAEFDFSSDELYEMIIPQKKENLSVYVEYTVETVSVGGTDNSTIENKITTVIPSIDFQAGKAYTLNLVLGMNSVKLDASVDDWTGVADTEVDLPENF